MSKFKFNDIVRHTDKYIDTHDKYYYKAWICRVFKLKDGYRYTLKWDNDKVYKEEDLELWTG